MGRNSAFIGTRRPELQFQRPGRRAMNYLHIVLLIRHCLHATQYFSAVSPHMPPIERMPRL